MGDVSNVSAPEVDPARIPVPEGEEPWTSAEVDEVLADLLDTRASLTARLAAQEVEIAGLFADSGDGAGPDAADLGASRYERDQELNLVSGERDGLAQVDHALARLESGEFGRCESCQQPITKPRVMAFPRATLCMSCKQAALRRNS